MGDTLSQEEIDNLLKAFNDGDLNADDFSDTKEKQVKNYDFARPSKFSKDHRDYCFSSNKYDELPV